MCCLIHSVNRIAEDLEIIDGPAAAATDEVQYIYGWERDLRRAWRIRVGDPAKEKELSDEPRYLKGACDWEPIFADFPDGPYEINDVTVAEWKEMKKGRGSRPKHDAPLWEMRHVTSKNELTINQRTDRKLLLSLYEQSKQILQLTMENWGPLPGVQPSVVDRSDPTLKAALAFLTPIAEAYGRNEIQDVPLLKKIRNKKMKEQGIKMRGPPKENTAPKKMLKKATKKMPKQATKKMPAAASSTTPTAGPTTPTTASAPASPPSMESAKSPQKRPAGASSHGSAKQAASSKRVFLDVLQPMEMPMLMEDDLDTQLKLLRKRLKDPCPPPRHPRS